LPENIRRTQSLYRRTMLRGGMAGAVTLGLGARAGFATDNTVRIGFLYPNLTTLILGVAQQIGAYQRQNLTVKDERFTSGQSVDGAQALWTGDLDLYFGGGPEVATLDSRSVDAGSGAPVAVVSGANAGHTNFVLGNKIKATSFDELVGHNLRIAVSSPSSDHLALFQGWLRVEKHMTPDQLGWQFLPVQGADMPTALLTDQIDGFLHSEPTTTLAIMSHAGRLFMSARSGDFGKDPPPMTFLMGNRAFLEKKPDLARRFMAAVFDANAHYSAASKEDNIKLISSWSGVKPEVLQIAYPRINPIMSMTKAQAQKWWDYIGVAMVARGEVSKKIEPFRDLFALQFQPLPASEI
jgi:ABC-type nitrate/sulfonate/bicarbonate transport system substrate-binding protein